LHRQPEEGQKGREKEKRSFGLAIEELPLKGLLIVLARSIAL
jgi:hypothetical protein